MTRISDEAEMATPFSRVDRRKASCMGIFSARFLLYSVRNGWCRHGDAQGDNGNTGLWRCSGDLEQAP